MRKRTMMELNRLDIEAFKTSTKVPLVVILDNIRSALNVGAAFRTSDAFALEGIALCGITAQPPHREILKTALGAHQSIAWQYFEKTTAALAHYKAQNYQLVAVEQVVDSIPLQEFEWNTSPLAIIMGNEVEGVADEVIQEVDHCIEIPQFGIKHSLNISVSLGITLWELFSQYKNWKK